jgi:hypothetical protein
MEMYLGLHRRDMFKRCAFLILLRTNVRSAFEIHPSFNFGIFMSSTERLVYFCGEV